MIFGNRVAKVKLVEQLTLVTLQTAHHGSTSPRIRVNTTESRFADCLNRLLQQNLPIRDISARPGSGILSAASQTGPQQPGARSLPCPLMTVGS